MYDRRRGSHDPCGQRWRNYSVSYTKDRERNFVSEPIGAKLAWTLKVISLSGLKRRVRRKSGAPPNKRRRPRSTHKTEQWSPRSLFVPHKTHSLGDSVEGNKTVGITERTVLMPCFYIVKLAC